MSQLPTPRRRPKLSLSGAVYGFVLIALLLAGTGAGLTVLVRSQAVIDATLDSIVRIRTVASGQFFARRLHDDWTDLRNLAEVAGEMDAERLRAMLAGMQGDGSRLSWIGFADVEGEVLEATNDMLVGADVSSRPWFTNGLRGDFAGDMHEAVLLANLLGSDDDNPLRFVDLATPVRNDDGEVIGVLGAHVNAAWVAALLRETGAQLEQQLYLINNAGTVMMGPDDSVPDLSGLELVGSARTGAVSAQRETWPDGNSYFTALVPAVTYRDLPSFGWRLAGRIDPDAYRPSYDSLIVTALYAGGVALVILMLATLVFVRIFVHPLDVLGRQATRITKGEDVFPAENSSTLEAERISRAFARLQGLAVSPARPPEQSDGADRR